MPSGWRMLPGAEYAGTGMLVVEFNVAAPGLLTLLMVVSRSVRVSMNGVNGPCPSKCASVATGAKLTTG